MEYYSAIKNKVDTLSDLSGPQGNYAKWKKPTSKGYILYDSSKSINYLELRGGEDGGYKEVAPGSFVWKGFPS